MRFLLSFVLLCVYLMTHRGVVEARIIWEDAALQPGVAAAAAAAAPAAPAAAAAPANGAEVRFAANHVSGPFDRLFGKKKTAPPVVTPPLVIDRNPSKASNKPSHWTAGTPPIAPVPRPFSYRTNAFNCFTCIILAELKRNQITSNSGNCATIQTYLNSVLQTDGVQYFNTVRAAADSTCPVIEQNVVTYMTVTNVNAIKLPSREICENMRQCHPATFESSPILTNASAATKKHQTPLQRQVFDLNNLRAKFMDEYAEAVLGTQPTQAETDMINIFNIDNFDLVVQFGCDTAGAFKDLPSYLPGWVHGHLQQDDEYISATGTLLANTGTIVGQSRYQKEVWGMMHPGIPAAAQPGGGVDQAFGYLDVTKSILPWLQTNPNKAINYAKQRPIYAGLNYHRFVGGFGPDKTAYGNCALHLKKIHKTFSSMANRDTKTWGCPSANTFQNYQWRAGGTFYNHKAFVRGLPANNQLGFSKINSLDSAQGCFPPPANPATAAPTLHPSVTKLNGAHPVTEIIPQWGVGGGRLSDFIDPYGVAAFGLKKVAGGDPSQQTSPFEVFVHGTVTFDPNSVSYVSSDFFGTFGTDKSGATTSVNGAGADVLEFSHNKQIPVTFVWNVPMPAAGVTPTANANSGDWSLLEWKEEYTAAFVCQNCLDQTNTNMQWFQSLWNRAQTTRLQFKQQYPHEYYRVKELDTNQLAEAAKHTFAFRNVMLDIFHDLQAAIQKNGQNNVIQTFDPYALQNS